MTTTFSREQVLTTPQIVINAGVIGFGFIGEVHVRAIRAAGGWLPQLLQKLCKKPTLQPKKWEFLKR